MERLNIFQSQYGTIKSISTPELKSTSNIFQSQYGTIKSFVNRAFRKFDCIFQSQYGTIKSILLIEPALTGMEISIPVWYD